MLGTALVTAGTLYFGLRSLQVAKELGFGSTVMAVKDSVNKAKQAVDEKLEIAKAQMEQAALDRTMSRIVANATPEERELITKILQRS